MSAVQTFALCIDCWEFHYGIPDSNGVTSGDPVSEAASTPEDVYRRRLLSSLLAEQVPEIAEARLAALKKHGWNSIEHLDSDDPRWLPILVEEVGEIATALLNGDRTNLREELVDVLAVASSWLSALGPKPKGTRA